jgi:hypothetical protein
MGDAHKLSPRNEEYAKIDELLDRISALDWGAKLAGGFNDIESDFGRSTREMNIPPHRLFISIKKSVCIASHGYSADAHFPEIAPVSFQSDTTGLRCVTWYRSPSKLKLPCLIPLGIGKGDKTNWQMEMH